MVITNSTGLDVSEHKRMAIRILSGGLSGHDAKDITTHHLFDFEIDSVAAARGRSNAAAATDNEGFVSSLEISCLIVVYCVLLLEDSASHSHYRASHESCAKAMQIAFRGRKIHERLNAALDYAQTLRKPFNIFQLTFESWMRTLKG